MEIKSEYLRPFSSGSEILIEPTDGKEMIIGCPELFAGTYELDFERKKINVPSEPKPGQKVIIYEMVKNGGFKDIFSSLSDFRRLWFTQSQFISFVRGQRRWVSKIRWTFVLIMVGDKFYVMRVRIWDDAKCEIGIDNFADGFMWSMGKHGETAHRFVAPVL